MAGGTCTIGPGITVNGRISGDDDVVVFGRVEGEISITANLIIEPGGVVVSTIEAQNMTVRGTAQGETVIQDLATLEATSVFQGTLRAPRIVIDEGCRISGEILMDV
ncbi:MAG: polymer-forming cytoskeletal protein [Myxococcota bacterium]